MAGSRFDEAPSTVVIEYSSGKELMKHGAEALHEHVSTRTKAAMGRAPPQLEVRVQNLSLSAEIVVSRDAKDDKPELPTVANEFKKRFSRFSAKKHKVTKRILQDLNIVLKPGTMTLVLGQPGSGKSSLMKILSGRFPMAKNIKMSGKVSFNGTPLEDQHLKRCLPQFASYVTQRDHHFPTLTAKETVSFAHECCGGEWLSERTERVCTAGSPQENQAAMEAARALNKHLPEVMIHQLGLEECQNTVVGDTMTRGVSGGERKRVTTGEMLFGDKSLLLMDEISTGLDSAATYDIIKTQRSLAKTFQKTVVIALLQPPPEVFDLFDNVLILNKGHVMYNGPREQALGYFEGLGFKCPPNRDVADFLMDLGTRQQRQYENTESDVVLPRKVHEFVARFEQSVFFETVVADLNEPMSPERIRDKEEFYDTMPEFHQSFFASTMTVLRRQGILMKRNTPFLVSRGIMVTVMGLLYASVFWQLDPKNAQVLMGILFQSVLFLAMGHAAQIPTFMAAREIFYKQRGANFYRTSSYVLANGVNQIPLAVLETLLFGTMQYWMCGLVSSFVPYLIFELLLFLMNLSFASLFFFLAAVAPDLHIAKPLSMVVVVFFVLHAGFVITEDQMPDYLVWVFWINPIAWCLRGLAINQYRRAEFDVCLYDGVDYCKKYGMEMSKYSLSLFNVKSDESWLYWGFVFLGVSYVIFMILAWATLEFKRYESPEHIVLDEEENHKTTNIDQLSASSVSSGSDYALVSTPTERKTPTQQQLETVVTVAPERQSNVAPVTLAFRDLWYSVPDPKDPKGPQLDLLKGISGYVLPGTITALMGSSGAGKTTLMDVIAGRKTGGKIKGDILLNGYPATDLAIRRATGYCEQMDIHSDGSTFREALTFSAFLRQSSDVPDSQKYDSVTEALELLDLHPIADQIIRGSSVEQMKRLTIGVELAAQPSVLFLDEPTSGLDARSAKVIMDGVRKVADSGRTVVCTIHQPSAEVFSVFDSLLLLKRGGQTVFFGDLGSHARELINYFEAIPNVAALEPGYNPATWMLEVIGAGVGHAGQNDTDFVARFNGSEKKALLDENLARPGICTPAPSSVELSFAKKRAATNTTQARFMIKRFLDLYWRTPSYNFTRYMMYIIVALLFGLLYLNSNYKTYQGINAGVGLVFMSTLFVGMTSYNSVLPIASQDRSAFYRERASQTYNAVWYFVGSTVAELPYVITSTLLFTAIFFPMVGLSDADRFFLYWAGVALFVLFQTYFGQLLVYAMPSVEVAVIIGVLLNSIFMLFIGYNPPSSTIPTGYKWLYYITPHRYIISVLVATAFGDCDEGQEGISDSIGCARLENLPPTVSANLTVKGYVEEVFDMHHDDIGKNLGIFIGCIAIIRILAALALRYINHQKR